MGNVISTDTLPTTEAQVIANLAVKPDRVTVTMTQDREQGDPRHWVKLQYEFKDKLPNFGKFLYRIACDVEQAGGWVTNVELATGLRTANERPDDHNPYGKWRAMHVEVSIRTQAELHAQRTMWDEAVKDIFRRSK